MTESAVTGEGEEEHRFPVNAIFRSTEKGAIVARTPTSMLSLTDFNGDPLADELAWSSFQTLMDQNGYVVLRNVPDDFDHVEFCSRLGSFVPDYTGLLVGDIAPQEGMDDVYHSGNTRPLLPHTEGYDFNGLPPRYIALWCITPVKGAGGETTLVDAYRWLEQFGEEELGELAERVYEWKTTDGVIRLGLQLSTRHPILEDHELGRIVRFSYNNLLRDGDSFADRMLEDGKDFFDRECVGVEYDRGDMLVWDNWRMFHARNAFTDRGRHLKRVQIGVAAPTLVATAAQNGHSVAHSGH